MGWGLGGALSIFGLTTCPSLVRATPYGFGVVKGLMPSEQAEKFLRWAHLFVYWSRRVGERQLSSEVRDQLIKRYADLPEGREFLAHAYLNSSHEQAVVALRGGDGEVRRACLRVEAFIECFPVGERFSDPLIRMREDLIDLYAYLSPRYESSGSTEQPARQPCWEDEVKSSYDLEALEAEFRQRLYADPGKLSRYKRAPVI